MKTLIVLMLVSIIGAAVAKDISPRGCIWVNGHCFEECPEGTHSYTTGCGPRTPEPTCEDPTPQQEKAMICDYSACYCDPPTLRHSSGKCVMPEQC